MANDDWSTWVARRLPVARVPHRIGRRCLQNQARTGTDSGRYVAGVDDFSWTDETWREYRSRADDVTVTLRFLGADFEPVEEWLLDAGDTGGLEAGTTDQDQILRAVEALGRRNGEPVYVLRIEESKTSWGADGGALNVILDTVQDVMSEATWAALGAIGSMIAGKVRDRLGHSDMSEEEAVEAARRRLHDRHALDSSDLTITGVSLQPGEAEVTFDCPPRSRRYTVTIAQDSPWMRRYRIAWESS